MMKKTTKQLLSMLLAIVMVIGLAVPAMAARPMGDEVVETPAGEAAPAAAGSTGVKKTLSEIVSEKAKLMAVGDEHKLLMTDAALSSITADNYQLTKDTTFGDGYFKLTGASTATWDANTKARYGSGAVTCIELPKKAVGPYLEFTTDGAATVVVSMSSNGGNNISSIALYGEDGAVTITDFTGGGTGLVHELQANDTIAVQEGTTAASVTFNVTEAGTYQLRVPDSATSVNNHASTPASQDPAGRSVRVQSVVVTDKASSGTVTKIENKLLMTDAALSSITADNYQLAKDTTFDNEFFKLTGASTATWDANTKARYGSGAVTCIELPKKAVGPYLEFTVTYPATVVVSMSSNGGNNVSSLALYGESGAVTITDFTGGGTDLVHELQANDTIAVQEGTTAASVTFNVTAAGTYQLRVPDSATSVNNHASTPASQDPAGRSVRIQSVVVTQTPPSGPAKDISVTSVTLKKGNDDAGATLTLAEAGTEETLTAEVVLGGEDKDEADESWSEVKWESSDDKVATVDGGKITAVDAGTATITATSKKDKTKKDTIEVTVTVSATVTSVTLKKGTADAGDTAAMKVGEGIKLTADVVTSDGAPASYSEVTWSTSDASKVAVTDGVVVARAAGTATITATAKKDANKKDTIEVTVTANAANVHVFTGDDLWELGEADNTKRPTASTAATSSAEAVIKDLTTDIFTAQWSQRAAYNSGNSTVDKFGPYVWDNNISGIVDGVNDFAGIHRLKLDTANQTVPAFLKIAMNKKATVELWWVSNLSGTGTFFVTTDITKREKTDTQVLKYWDANDRPKVGGSVTPYYEKFDIDGTAGNYFIGNMSNQNSIMKIRVTEKDENAPIDLDALIASVNAATYKIGAANAANATAAAAALKSQVETIVDDSRVTVEINTSDFTAATAGTHAAPAGTAGSVKFTAKLTTAADSTGKTSSEKTATIEQVAWVDVTSITVTAANNATSVEASPLKTLQLTATALPAGASDKSVTWSVATADQQYLTVNASGVVTGKKATPDGTKVTVTATAKDGSGVSGTIQLAVTAAVADPNALQAVNVINDGEGTMFSFKDQLTNVTNDDYLTDAEVAALKEAGFQFYETGTGTKPAGGGSNLSDAKGFLFKRKGPYLMLGKAELAGLQFLVDGSAGPVNVKIEFASTGGSNYSPAGLYKDFTGEKIKIREDEGQTEAYGTTWTEFNYTGLGEGLYYICSPENAAYGRGVRIQSIEVVPTGPDDIIPAPHEVAWNTVIDGTTVTFGYEDGDDTIAVTAKGAKIGVVDTPDAEDSKVNNFDVYATSITASLVDESGKAITTTKAVTVADDSGTLGSDGKTVTWEDLDLSLTPAASGAVKVKVVVEREGEKKEFLSDLFQFDLPLKAPQLDKTESLKGCIVNLEWGAVTEADKYELRYGPKGTEYTDTEHLTVIPLEKTVTKYSFTGATALTDYAEQTLVFHIVAIRDAASGAQVPKAAVSCTSQNLKISANDMTAWKFSTFGTSATKALNYKEGDLNADGEIKLFSKNGAGKIQETYDGIAFYYTAIPAGTNYKLEADMYVDRWYNNSSQNGAGLAALDRVEAESASGDASKNSGPYWNNSYMVGAIRESFYYDADTDKAYADSDAGAAGTRYSYYIGLTSHTRNGVPKDYDKTAQPPMFLSRSYPLDLRIPRAGLKNSSYSASNRFCTIGNHDVIDEYHPDPAEPAGECVAAYMLTKVHLVLEKSNTGYTMKTFAINEDGSLGVQLGEDTRYFTLGAQELSGTDVIHNATDKGDWYAVDVSGRDPEGTLEAMKPEYEYVGFFTARDMDATFSNVTLTTKAAAEDEAPKIPPITYVNPTFSINSGTASNSKDYTLIVSSNVNGSFNVKVNGVTVANENPNGVDSFVYEDKDGVHKYTPTLETATSFQVYGGMRRSIEVELTKDINSIVTEFTPDPNQDLGAYVEFASGTANRVITNANKPLVVKYDDYFQKLDIIYVANDANNTGFGTYASPVDVYTAIAVAAPGQKIVLKGGVYNLGKEINPGKGVSGTEEKPIYFMAEPGAKVVLNAQTMANNVMTHSADYWIIRDLEFVGAGKNKAGLQLSGSNNIVQNCVFHDNAGTGMQISGSSSESRATWPKNNLVVNCDSYLNYDQGYSDADGFGAKLTIGEGNVFDGCAAFWNADDGWDMFAKAESGPIGKVVIKNSITFENGYEVRQLQPNSQDPVYEADGYSAKLNLDENGKIIYKDAGNGNGFKMGGSNLPGPHEIYNSYTFYNRAKGFDANSGPNIKVYGGTSYNNGGGNIGLTSTYDPLDYLVQDTVSFKDAKAPSKASDSAPSGGTSTYNYFQWNGSKSNGVGTYKGQTIKASNFVSLDWDPVAWFANRRNAEGNLDLGDFLKLQNAPTNADGDSVGAGDMSVDPDDYDQDISDPTDVPSVDGDHGADETPSGTPSGGGGGGGAPSGAGVENHPVDSTTGTTTPAPKPEDFTATGKTDAEGNKEIAVVGKDGEIVANVKVPASIPASDIVFEDVADDHWAAEAINNMAALGIVNGVSMDEETKVGVYDTNSSVTRGTIATMLYRFADGVSGKPNTFADVVGGMWYTDAIGWAASTGVVTGYSETTFGPNDVITREQLGVMLYRFAKLIGLDTRAASSSMSNFEDAASVSAWAEEGMAWCVTNGIINGITTETLSPGTTATRAQVAVMLNRFVGLIK